MKNNKEFTKQIIIDAAIKLISANGFNATTTALIAREAGFSEAIIFKYYCDKKTLLKEIAKKALNQIIEIVSIAPMLKNIEISKDYPPKEFIKSIFMERLSFLEKNLDLIKILIIEIQYNRELFLLVKKTIYEEANEIIANLLQILSQKLQISNYQAEAVSRLCIGLLGTIIIQKYFLLIEFKPEKMEAEIDQALDIILKGL